MTDIILRSSPRYDPTVVDRLVTLSRRVARDEIHHSKFQSRLVLLTDDADLANDRLVDRDEPVTPNRFLGMHWGRSGVIWVKPGSGIDTLTHEVAHLLSVGAHGVAWRRTFVVLLPLWYLALGVPDRRPLLGRTAYDTITHYDNRRSPIDDTDLVTAEAIVTSRRAHEARGHIRAARHALPRWAEDFTAATHVV